MLTDLTVCPLPAAVKILYTLFVCVLVPAYWRQYGPANFLWFSDLALLIGLAALWLESPLLASMQAVSVLLLELIWSAEFLLALVTRKPITGLVDYMFKSDKPLWLRGLSLFHLALPPLLLWLVYCFGYDRRAWIAQTILFWVVVPICFFFTKPSENINWVFGPGERPQQRISPRLYFISIMAGVPLFIYLPTHFLLITLLSK
jgi:hypothetical protein